MLPSLPLYPPQMFIIIIMYIYIYYRLCSGYVCCTAAAATTLPTEPLPPSLPSFALKPKGPPLHKRAKSRDREVGRGQRKRPKAVQITHRQNHVVWSRTLKCSVIGASIKCYLQ
jgi:hypothetical protein